MLKPKSPQESFYGTYLYDRIVPIDHLLRKINQIAACVPFTLFFREKHDWSWGPWRKPLTGGYNS